MSTQLDAIDLTWVEFSEEEDQVCTTYIDGGCSHQAVWVARFSCTCEHWPKKQFYCDKHKEVQLEIQKTYPIRSCWAMASSTMGSNPGEPNCNGKMTLVNLERLNK